jgi:hypothetical protein
MVVVALLGALSIYYSTLRPDGLRLSLTAAFAAATGVALVAMPFRRGFAVWGVLTALVVTWYFQDPASNDRDWAPEYAVLASSSRAGDLVFVHDIRNFTYRSETDFIPAYYDETFSLNDLASVDLISSHWSGEAIAHVFLSFGLRDGRYLAISIETRRQRGAGYSTLAGFFRHFELIYVVADERDLIGLRTDIRHERVFLYRLHLRPQVRETLFLSYLDKVNKLYRQPRWYNTLTDNCTTGILARANAQTGVVRYNWRILLSGFAAEYAYMLGLLDTSMPFPELRRESLIIRPPGASIDADFSKEIRQGLPLN